MSVTVQSSQQRVAAARRIARTPPFVQRARGQIGLRLIDVGLVVRGWSRRLERIASRIVDRGIRLHVGCWPTTTGGEA